jgi:Leucine-rich repeat (LRR) protein
MFFFFSIVGIKNLKNLELFNFDRNFITEVPHEITECKNIFQLSFEECARLFSIPKNLFAMPKLVSASFRGCNLISIPSIITSNVCHLSIYGNQLLNSIPHEIFTKFIPNNLSASDFYMIDEQSLEELHAAR